MPDPNRDLAAQHRRRLMAVLAVALAVRLAAVGYWHARTPDGLAFPDGESYLALGRAIAGGDPYQFGPDRVFRTPGYPLVLAPIFWIAGPAASLVWPRLTSALLGTLAVAAAARLGTRAFDRRVGLAVAAVVAVHPEAVAASVFVLSEAAFIPLAVVQLALWVELLKAERLRPCAAVGAGLLAGAATLVRPSWLPFTPLMAVAMLAGGAPRRRAAEGLLITAGLVAALCPWWVRNYYVTRHFVPTTLQVGASLYDGLNARANGSSDMRPVAERAAAIRAEWKRLGTEPPAAAVEWALDRQLRTEAIDWAKTHPGKAVALAGTKIWRTWNIWPNEASLAAWPLRLAIVFAYVPLVVLGIIAAWRTLGRVGPLWLCWGPAVYFTAVHAIFVGSLRYRGPAMVPLAVLAVGLVCSIRRTRTIA